MAGISLYLIVRAIGISRAGPSIEWRNPTLRLQRNGPDVQRPTDIFRTRHSNHYADSLCKCMKAWTFIRLESMKTRNEGEHGQLSAAGNSIRRGSFAGLCCGIADRAEMVCRLYQFPS